MTMVVDSSALVAILELEEDAELLARALAGARVRWISTATVVEAGIVMLRRRGAEGSRDLDSLLARLSVEAVPVSEEHARLAREGFARFGKGQHAAGLNYGDCFSYALARAADAPLLCKGDEFTRTDVAVVPIGRP